MENKLKIIKITEKTHEIAKSFCKKRALKLYQWIEKIILEKIEEVENKNDNL
jgi:hypothetical protein